MGFLADMLSKAKTMLSAPPPPSGVETVAVRHDRYDHEDWIDVRDKSRDLQDVIDDLGQTFDYVEDLAEGMFDYLIKSDPQVHDETAMDVTRKPNRQVTMESASTPKVEELRGYTKGDPYAAAMGVSAISEKLRERLSEHKEIAEAAAEAERRRQEARQAEQAANDAAQQAEAQAGDYDGDGPMTQQQQAAADALQAALDALANAQAAEAQANANLDAQMGQAAPSVRTAVREGIQDATEQAEAEQAAMIAAGVDPGEAKHMPFEEREALAAVLANSRLRQMAKWIGRFRMEARAEQARRVEGRELFVDVELGNDMSRVLGSEIAKFASPVRAVRLDTLVRYQQRRLLQRQFEGVEKQGKGTICAVVDTSGSMMGNIGGVNPGDFDQGLEPSREAWAKAITFVLLDSARRQKRDFYAILFSSAGEQRHYSFPNGGKPQVYQRDGRTPIDIAPIGDNYELPVVLDLITFLFNGGTDFEQPLTQAIDVICQRFDENGRPKADIAFITDDDGHVSPAFMSKYNAARERVGIRTFGFAVGCSVGNTLEAVSDNVRSLVDLADTDEVRDVFRTI